MTSFHMDGPHSPDTTREAADLVAEGVRYLNHALMPGAGGLENPGDAYSLLGELYTATGRLPQLFGQVAGLLLDWHAGGRMADSGGLDPAAQVGHAGFALGEARIRALSLTSVLQEAQNAISGLHVKDDDDA